MKIEVISIDEFWDGSANVTLDMDTEAVKMLLNISITHILQGYIEDKALEKAEMEQMELWNE